jgi:hypothetical protein
MIGPAPKPQNMYDSWKNDVSIIDELTKFRFFAINYGSMDVLIWIKVEVELWNCLL